MPDGTFWLRHRMIDGVKFRRVMTPDQYERQFDAALSPSQQWCARVLQPK